MKKLCSKQVKKAHVNFINKRVISELEDENTKPFWSYINSLRREGIGTPLLKVEGTLYSSARDKASILTEEFQSVFTREEINERV